MTDLDLNAIEARAAAATEGPWACRPTIDANDELREAIIAKGAGNTTVVDECDEPDATFIAHARSDVPALVAEVRRLAHLEGQISDAKVQATRAALQISYFARRLHLLRDIVAAHPDAELLLTEWEIQVERSP